MRKTLKTTLILTSLLTLLPIPVWLVVTGAWNGILLMPLEALVVQNLCYWWTVKDPTNKDNSPKPLKVVLWAIPLMTNMVCAMMLAFHQGVEFSVTRLYCQAFGVLFVLLGNYLPKCRMSNTMGIKVPWAYTSEKNWNATHRFGGKLWLSGGLLMIFAAFLPEVWAAWVMGVTVLAISAAPVVYSWAYYRRQRANGEAVTPLPKVFGRGGRIAGVFAVGLVVFLCVILFTGDIAVTFGEESFFIDASYHDDLTVEYADITAVELRQENISGSRVWGFGSPRLLLGRFENEEFGGYTRYTYGDPGACVVIWQGEKVLVLSARDPVGTRALYDEILTRIEK